MLIRIGFFCGVYYLFCDCNYTPEVYLFSTFGDRKMICTKRKTSAAAICAPTFVPVIRSERQRRALAALAANDGQSAKQLRELVGMNNIPELMAQLRRNGWKWTCELIEAIDRDGHVCRPGIYHLTPEHRKLAAEMLCGG
jgi:hypothetical protein